ncbi:hypothetical protein HanRHA438_Chr05g0205941 [Helianthus annuus]|nr:hypothetical protein HanRHA438_Chr05g0205941 [Helianthus annuus]
MYTAYSNFFITLYTIPTTKAEKKNRNTIKNITSESDNCNDVTSQIMQNKYRTQKRRRVTKKTEFLSLLLKLLVIIILHIVTIFLKGAAINTPVMLYIPRRVDDVIIQATNNHTNRMSLTVITSFSVVTSYGPYGWMTPKHCGPYDVPV